MKKIWASLFVLALFCLVVYSANEVKMNAELTVEKGQLRVSRDPGTIDVDMAGNAVSDNVDTILNTATSTITITANVATNGITFFQAMTTNTTWYVDIGRLVGGALYRTVRIKGGEGGGPIRIHPTNTLSATAFGGSFDLRTTVVED